MVKTWNAAGSWKDNTVVTEVVGGMMFGAGLEAPPKVENRRQVFQARVLTQLKLRCKPVSQPS